MNRDRPSKNGENIRLVRDERGKPLFRPDIRGIPRYVLVGERSYRLDAGSTVDEAAAAHWDQADIKLTRPGLGPKANQYQEPADPSTLGLTRYALKDVVLGLDNISDNERLTRLSHLGFSLQEVACSAIVYDELPETATGH